MALDESALEMQFLEHYRKLTHRAQIDLLETLIAIVIEGVDAKK